MNRKRGGRRHLGQRHRNRFHKIIEVDKAKEGSIYLLGTKKGAQGKRGEEKPTPRESFTYSLVCQAWESCHTLSTQPWVGIQASDPMDEGWTRGSLQNQKGPKVTPCSPGLWEKGLREETQVRVSAVDFDWSTGRPSTWILGMAHWEKTYSVLQEQWALMSRDSLWF